MTENKLVKIYDRLFDRHLKFLTDICFLRFPEKLWPKIVTDNKVVKIYDRNFDRNLKLLTGGTFSRFKKKFWPTFIQFRPINRSKLNFWHFFWPIGQNPSEIQKFSKISGYNSRASSFASFCVLFLLSSSSSTFRHPPPFLLLIFLLYISIVPKFFCHFLRSIGGHERVSVTVAGFASTTSGLDELKRSRDGCCIHHRRAEVRAVSDGSGGGARAVRWVIARSFQFHFFSPIFRYVG